MTAWKWMTPRRWYSATLVNGVGQSGAGGEQPRQVHRRATPQLGGEGVEQDGAGGVVTLLAQRRADDLVVAGVDAGADGRLAVFAPLPFPFAQRVARPAPAGGAAGGVHEPERWCGERREHGRVLGDG
jgi:hypothetical protein